MSMIAFNALLRIDDEQLDGLFRVIADPVESDDVFLARFVTRDGQQGGKDYKQRVLLMPAARQMLRDLEERGCLRAVELIPHRRSLISETELNQAERTAFAKRRLAMQHFMNHRLLCDAVTSPHGFGPLVRRAMEDGGLSRAGVYRLRDVLFELGLLESSLYPRFSECGAPGKPKFCDGREKAGRKSTAERLGYDKDNLQQGVTSAWAVKVVAVYMRIQNPKPALKEVHAEIIEKGFATRYMQTKDGLIPILPPRGTFPNKKQVQRILEREIKKIDRLANSTTQGHFKRNLRGLQGVAHQGVSGPGHVYAIDSTIGDIYLRSSINRAWHVGRPLVYIIVDVWSTAVVGFYVSLRTPSWETARIALFSACAPQDLVAELWGYTLCPCLTPEPTVPYEFLCDRGEYLSKAAEETGKALGVNLTYNPSYRPDLKGTVEVLHRIAKDGQFRFTPGAIDARRAELELRPDLRDSAYTVREYVQYLYWTFTQLNLFADRSHRMTSEMIAAGISPTPAGLHRFGYEAGIGYRKVVSTPKLITDLLPTKEAVVNRKGIYLGRCLYESEHARQQQWTAQARSFGTRQIMTRTFPGNVSTIWWPEAETGALHKFRLSPNATAAPNTTHDELVDAAAYQLRLKPDREYQQLQGQLEHRARVQALNKRAIEQTKQAEEEHSGSRPSIREARVLESEISQGATAGHQSDAESRNSAETPAFDLRYDELMDHVFSAGVSRGRRE